MGERANDADCDGARTQDDCDDTNESLGSRDLDADCDGVLTNDDCDDNDSSSTVIATDADCDGVITNEDCDDADPHLTLVSEDADVMILTQPTDDDDTMIGSNALDADCDGTLIADDCDDNDASVGSITNDADCDRVPTASDCDDNNAALGSILADFDCDGVYEIAEVCGDGIDNDHNGLMDCEDALCFTAPGCFEDCTDGTDNDGDYLSDCDDDDCWGTSSCTTGYTLIQQNGWYEDSDYDEDLPDGWVWDNDLTITNFEGVLRIPTGPNSFDQCSWTVDTVHHSFYRAFSSWWGSYHYHWSVTNSTAIERTNFVLNPSCAFTQTSVENLFLGTALNLFYPNELLWNPTLNQRLNWYVPHNLNTSFSGYTVAHQGFIDPDHKIDVSIAVYDQVGDGVYSNVDCDDNDSQLGSTITDQDCDGVID